MEQARDYVTFRTTLPLAERIAHTDSSQFRKLNGPHGGAGSMEFGSFFEADGISTNLIFMHAGRIGPKSGIGHHFHHKCEEMFVILDGEAEFTIDGRSSLIKGPAAVPCCMGHSHAIYNPTNTPVQWLNVNVSMSKVYDAFDLGDSRENAVLELIPQFVSARMDRTLLKPYEVLDGGKGVVQHRRLFHPTVFSTTWAYVDHLLLPPNSGLEAKKDLDMSEVYYVMAGTGDVLVDGAKSTIRTGDAIPIDLGQSRALHASDSEPLELLIIGVAKDIPTKAAIMSTGSGFKN
jgi:mannose-6-phosphate isomerase-like protein (cupin superfamily)